MLVPIIASTITGCCMLLAAYLTHLLSREKVTRSTRHLSEALNNTSWSGTATETSSTTGLVDNRKYEVTWHFTAKRTTFNAVSTTRHTVDGKTIEDTFKLSGKLIHENFLQLEYVNTNRGIINFGTELLRLSENGTTFSGQFVGFSADHGGMITGMIDACRI